MFDAAVRGLASDLRVAPMAVPFSAPAEGVRFREATALGREDIAAVQRAVRKRVLPPRRSPKHGPVRPMRHYLLQTRVGISTVQRDHHLEARMGITQAQCAAVRFGDLTAEIEP